MKKLSVVACLLLFFSASLFAQNTKIIMDDWFSDNSNQWPIVDNDKVETGIDDGYYTINCQDKDGYTAFKETALDYSKNFSIQAECKLEDGANNIGYGIVFGFRNWNNYYAFFVTGTGYYKVIHRYQGIFNSTGWVKNANVSSKGSTNRLKIVKVNDWLGFYLNSEFVSDAKDSTVPALVYSLKPDGFAGRQIGLLADGAQKIQFDRITIKELGPEETALYTDKQNANTGENRRVNLIADDFSSSLNNWYTENNDTNTVRAVTNGVYSFDNRKSIGFRSTLNAYLSAGGDFDIACTTKWVSGSDSSYYGIIWGFSDWSNYQEFLITPKGSVSYISYVFGNKTVNTASFKPAAENRMKAAKVNDSLYFYVNDAVVLGAPYLSPAGKEAGFIVYNKQKVLFDNLTISQVKSYPKVIRETIAAEETFKENKGAFSDKVEKSGFTKTWKPGILECAYTSDGGNAVAGEFYVDPAQDFSISAKFRWIQGDTTQGYGLLWGKKDWDNCNEFLISKNGYFKCITTHNKAVITTGWKFAPALLKNAVNTLEVQKHGNFAEYFINGHSVAFLPFYKLYGYTTGLMMYGKQTAGIEGLTIKSMQTSKPEFEKSHITFKEDYEDNKPSLQGMAQSGNQILLTGGGKLHLAALFPELEAFQGSDVSSYTTGNMLVTETRTNTQYPNKPFYQSNKDVLPQFGERGIPYKGFSVEVTVGIMSSSHSRGVGLRIGGNDFLVDADGNYVMDIQKPQPLSNDAKVSTNIYRLKVECDVYGIMHFYVNGQLAGYALEAMTNSDAGPIVYAFNSLTEAWFDDFVVRTY